MSLGEDEIRLQIAGTEVIVSVRVPGTAACTAPAASAASRDAAFRGLDATCRAVLHAVTHLLRDETTIALSAACAAQAGVRLAALTLAFVTDALTLPGLEADADERRALADAAAAGLALAEARQAIPVPDEVTPASHFSPLVPGMTIGRVRRVFRPSPPPAVTRPDDLDDVACWPVRHLSELLRTRQVTSVELTSLYLSRLRRDDPALHAVVTQLDDLALTQAAEADAALAAGRVDGPLHGIPWGAKDLIAVRGYPTTWGTAAYRQRVIDQDASVVRKLRAAGAVLVAKLATGELAVGDRWFGGRTNNPWNLAQGASGSSSGSAAATANGGVGFALGTETHGSILSPAARCGVVGLRPTFGRVSRHGVMSLAWSLDRVGPICRAVEDCALVMRAIAGPDGHDMSVWDLPFAWDASRDPARLRVGVIDASFEERTGSADAVQAARLLDALRAMKVRPVPVTVPSFETALLDQGVDGVEGAAFLDERLRRGELRDPRPGRQAARLVPAVEHLHTERLRTLMMMELAAATRDVDVYLALPSVSAGGDDGLSRVMSTTRRHEEMACLAGYPALALPTGVSPAGAPTSVTLFARPFGEAALLTLARACEAAAGPLVRRPPTIRM